MDAELFDKAIKSLCADTNLSKSFELFKAMDKTSFQLVNDKYLYVFPPIPGITRSNYDEAKNIISMKYNALYNLKNKIEFSRYESCSNDCDEVHEGPEELDEGPDRQYYPPVSFDDLSR